MEQKFRSLFDPNRSSVDLRFSIGDPLRSKIYSIYFLWKNFSILIRSSTDHRVDLGSALPCSEPCYSLSLPHDLLPHPFELGHKHYKTQLEFSRKIRNCTTSAQRRGMQGSWDSDVRGNQEFEEYRVNSVLSTLKPWPCNISPASPYLSFLSIVYDHSWFHSRHRRRKILL